ncbi:hypothetical protein Bbelb_446180 [Branchiostoma belcheri]|nr:hypothetical protein Bbelb_446180 [Branchiostoma belcheri]
MVWDLSSSGTEGMEEEHEVCDWGCAYTFTKQDFQNAHCERLADFLLCGKDAWWTVTEEGVTFHDGPSHPDSLPSGPANAMMHFRSIVSAEDTEEVTVAANTDLTVLEEKDEPAVQVQERGDHPWPAERKGESADKIFESLKRHGYTVRRESFRKVIKKMMDMIRIRPVFANKAPLIPITGKEVHHRRQLDLCDFKAFRRENVPHQTNCSDCGVFACMYADRVSKDANIDFTQMGIALRHKDSTKKNMFTGS